MIGWVMNRSMFFHEKTSNMNYALLFFSFYGLFFLHHMKRTMSKPQCLQSKQFIKTRDLTDIDILFGILTVLFKGMPCVF